ncbi:MAG: hypothetical protein ABWY20_12630 [Mycobacterium sp.]
MFITAESASVESASVESVGDSADLLIKEARKRASRRRLGFGAAAMAGLAAVAALGVALAVAGPARGPTPARDPAPPLDAATGAGPGIFEPVQGWIVYWAGQGLQAVDPADPSSRLTLEAPGGLVTRLVPAGWSADGTRLALTAEASGLRYVVDASGDITYLDDDEFCCWFVTSSWLSPDGTTVLEVDAADRLRERQLGNDNATRVIDVDPRRVDPPPGGLEEHPPAVAAWSPDGTEVAYAAYRQIGTELLPSVHITDLENGTTRQAIPLGFDHIRQMIWSPDGSRLLVIAGSWRQYPITAPSMPLTRPIETGLYLVSARGPATGAWAAPHEIASGHYVAATWSPDSAQIAAIDYAPTGRQLHLMDADGSNPQVLVEFPPTWDDLFTGLAWHPQPDR